MIPLVFESARQAAHNASRVCIIIDIIMILLFTGVQLAAFTVRPRGDSTAIRTRKFLYTVMASVGLAQLDRLVDLIHCALMLGKQLTASSFYIPFVFEELFCMAACTVLTWCTLFVLNNRAAAVHPAAGWRRMLRIGNMGIVAVTGLLSLLDVAFAAKWVACMISMVKMEEMNEGKAHHMDQAMVMEMKAWYHHWGAVLVAAHAWHTLMSLYVMGMAGALYKGAKSNSIQTRNIISLGLVGLYMLIRAANMLVNHALPMLAGAQLEPVAASMTGQMLVDSVPLLLAYGALVMVGKRHEELRGETERDNPFADPAPRSFRAGTEAKIDAPGVGIRSV